MENKAESDRFNEWYGQETSEPRINNGVEIHTCRKRTRDGNG